jgi:hypothetical protein
MGPDIGGGGPFTPPSPADAPKVGDFNGFPDPPAPPPQFNGSTDPNVLASLALEQQGLGQLDAGLKSARERAIISFGDPSLADEAGFGIDPQAGAFAKQNYLSGNATLARIDKSHELARQAVINRLVSHGLLKSGDLGYGESEADSQYGNNVYDAKQQLLDYLANLFGSYNDKRTTLQQSTLNARMNAINQFLSNPDAYGAAYGPPVQAQAQAPPVVAPRAPASVKKKSAPADALSRYLANANG